MNGTVKKRTIGAFITDASRTTVILTNPFFTDKNGDPVRYEAGIEWKRRQYLLARPPRIFLAEATRGLSNLQRGILAQVATRRWPRPSWERERWVDGRDFDKEAAERHPDDQASLDKNRQQILARFPKVDRAKVPHVPFIFSDPDATDGVGAARDDILQQHFLTPADRAYAAEVWALTYDEQEWPWSRYATFQYAVWAWTHDARQQTAPSAVSARTTATRRRYFAAHASLSRAVKQLTWRGLIRETGHPRRLKFTDAGHLAWRILDLSPRATVKNRPTVPILTDA